SVRRRTERDVAALPPGAAAWQAPAVSGEAAGWSIGDIVGHIGGSRLYFASAFRGEGWIQPTPEIDRADQRTWLPWLQASAGRFVALVQDAPAECLTRRVEMIDTPGALSGWRLLIFAWAANFVIRIGFSALLPSIMSELSLSYTRAGLLASAFFYAYVIMQIPSGLLGDRYGRRRILLLGLLGGALSAGLTGLAGSFAALFTARALTGAFQGSLFSNDRAIIATVTPPDRIGLGQGGSFSGPGIGLTFGLVIGGLLLE